MVMHKHSFAEILNEYTPPIVAGHLCLIYNYSGMILPAFGRLTGLYIIDPKPQEIVYGVVNSTLVKLS